MPKGWVGEVEISDEELEKRRKEAILGYQNEIDALKKQEIELKTSISDLRGLVDKALANRSAELDAKEEDLKNKMSDVENLNIKLRTLVSSYEANISAFQIEQRIFNDYRDEKQKEIDANLAEIESQKATLGAKLQAHEVSVSELTIKSEDHGQSVKEFNEQSALIEGKMQEAEEMKQEAQRQLDNLNTEWAINARIIQDSKDAKILYDQKNAELDIEREQLKALKIEYTEKIVRFNQEKTKLNDSLIQNKADRIKLEKDIVELNEKNRNLVIEKEKLEAIKAQLSGT